MGRLILQMNLTLDAFAADSHHKLDWMLPEQDDRQIAFLDKLTNRVSHIILGRKMAEESIPHWKNVAASGVDSKEVDFAKFFIKTPKTVFSSSAPNFPETNTSVTDSELSPAVGELKNKSKDDIIVYGGASLTSSLIDEKLIDELNLFFHPVALGQGLKIFNSLAELKLISCNAYSNGIVLKRFVL